MSDISEGVIFKLSAETVAKYNTLQTLYGFPKDELVSLILHTFILVTATIVEKKKSLFLYSAFPYDQVHVHTISPFLLFPENKAQDPYATFILTMPQHVMRMFKKVQQMAMLRSLSETFAAAVELCHKVTLEQIMRPKYILASAPRGGKAFLEVELSLNIHQRLDDRELRFVISHNGQYLLVHKNKTKKQQ